MAGLLVVVVVFALLAAFMMRQGLTRASLWATVLSVPLAVIAAGSGVWGVVISARALRQSRRAARDVGGEARATSPSPEGTYPGSIRQENSGGVNIAHTGEGDINYREP